MAKEQFDRSKPHVNIGTIGSVDDNAFTIEMRALNAGRNYRTWQCLIAQFTASSKDHVRIEHVDPDIAKLRRELSDIRLELAVTEKALENSQNVNCELLNRKDIKIKSLRGLLGESLPELYRSEKFHYSLIKNIEDDIGRFKKKRESLQSN